MRRINESCRVLASALVLFEMRVCIVKAVIGN